MLFFPNKSCCALCHNVILDTDKYRCFPPFVGNGNDPLFVLNDDGVHMDCYEKFPYHDMAERVLAKLEHSRKNQNYCAACQSQILNPDDFIGVGYLVNEENHPLYSYNFQCLHKQCRESAYAKKLLNLLDDFQAISNWKGDGLSHLINCLRN